MRWLAFVMLAACGKSFPPAPDAGPMPTGDSCNGVIVHVPLEPGLHVSDGTTVEWSSNPPATGTHYPVWAKWDRQFTVLARGQWLHNAEHGGVVFAYRCDAACDVGATLARIADALPSDPLCVAPIKHRVLVVADPLLPADGDVVAVSWGVYYTGTCVDEASLTEFYTAHHGRAIEDTCADGSGFYGGDPF